MKKWMSILLVAALLLGLCACGSSEPAPADKGEIQEVEPPQSAAEATESAAEETANYTALGEPIDLGFASMAFSSAALTYAVGGDGVSRNAQEGMRFFSLTGSIENTGGNPLAIESVRAQMVFNGEFTYNASAKILNSRSIPASVAPLASAEYWIFAEIPEALLEQLNVCEVQVALNEDFASVPETIDSGDYNFKFFLDESVCKAALDSVNTPTDFFEECPILPKPTNYGPVTKNSSSTSSRNGQVTSIKYGFGLLPGRSDDLVQIYSTYISKLQESGFTVENDTGTSCDISADGVKLASVSVDSSRIQFDIVPGNEGLAAPSGNAGETAPAAGENAVEMGGAIENDYVVLSLESFDSGMEIKSGTSQYGTYTYYTSDNGDPYFYLSGTIKNLGGNPVDVRNIYVQFCFDGKYNYKGSVDGVSEESSRFIHDLNPLSSVNYFMYTSVPQELLDSYSTCTVRIGFTENFDYKVVDVNDLPQFENCDDVYVLEIKR